MPPIPLLPRSAVTSHQMAATVCSAGFPKSGIALRTIAGRSSISITMIRYERANHSKTGSEWFDIGYSLTMSRMRSTITPTIRPCSV